MQFEKREITIDEQIRCVEKVIDEYKALVAFFDGPEDSVLRYEAVNDLAGLVAVKYMLTHLKSKQCQGIPVQITRGGQTNVNVH